MAAFAVGERRQVRTVVDLVALCMTTPAVRWVWLHPQVDVSRRTETKQ